MEEIKLKNDSELLNHIENILNDFLAMNIKDNRLFKILDFEAGIYREIYYFDIYNFSMVIHDGIAYVSTKFHNDGVCEMRKMSIEEKLELVGQMSLGSKVAYIEKSFGEVIQCIFNN